MGGAGRAGHLLGHRLGRMSALAYQSNAARSLTELMEVELRGSGGLVAIRRIRPWPCRRPTTNPTPARRRSAPRAARGSRLPDVDREMLGRPPAGTPPETEAADIARARRPTWKRCWRPGGRTCPASRTRSSFPAIYRSRWGEDFTIEQMLEHAVVHPMRHRIQLERFDGAGEKLAPAVPRTRGRRPAAEDDAFCREAERLQQIRLPQPNLPAAGACAR